jgi:prevent-host-death family protein
MKEIALSEIKDDFSRFLRQAASEQILITRHGRPAGILLGFANEDEWLDYRIENDPGFLDRIAASRASIKAGLGVRIEDIEKALAVTRKPVKSATPAKEKRAKVRSR